jgi:hypothetical protein
MLRQTSLPTSQADPADRSMRVAEYALAFVAALAAGVLALLR